MADAGSEPFDPYELLGALQRRHVSFVVIGAFARVDPRHRRAHRGDRHHPVDARRTTSPGSRRRSPTSTPPASTASRSTSTTLDEPVIELRDARRRAQARARAGRLARLRRPPLARKPRTARPRTAPPGRLPRRPRPHARRPRPRRPDPSPASPPPPDRTRTTTRHSSATWASNSDRTMGPASRPSRTATTNRDSRRDTYAPGCKYGS